MVHVVVDDVVGIDGGGGEFGVGAAGVVGFILRGLGLGVDAVEQCSVARFVVLMASYTQLAVAVKSIPAIGDGGFLEYVAVKRRIKPYGDAVADGKDDRPSGMRSLVIEGAGSSDGQSRD